MISVDEAVEIVLGTAETLAPITVFTEGSRGYVTSRPVIADMDSPSFDRVMMDGYALMAEFSGDGAVLPVDGIIGAGEFRTDPVPDGHAVKIMTGAPLPPGTDSVIQVELTSDPGNGTVKLNAKLKSGDNVSPQGDEVRKGSVLIPAGTVIDSPAASVCAMAGLSLVEVIGLPKVGVLPTGAELVKPTSQIPAPGYIRDTNTYGIFVQSLSWGGIPIRLGYPSDDPAKIRALIDKGLECDILVITGGVSMGDYDYVPDILKEAGVEILFHKVAQKPGKPILFGRRGEKYVFGLPGNPVAGYLGFELFIGPLIRRIAGETGFRTQWFKGIAAEDFKVKSDRTLFLVSKARWEDGKWAVYPVESKGSADIASVVGTNCFARFEEGRYTVSSGDEVNFFFTRGSLYGAQR